MYLELPRVRTHRVSAIEVSESMLLINRHPGPDEEGVPIDTTISLTVTSLMTAGIDSSATKVWVNDVIAFDISLQPGFNGPRASLELSGDTFKCDEFFSVLLPVDGFAIIDSGHGFRGIDMNQ